MNQNETHKSTNESEPSSSMYNSRTAQMMQAAAPYLDDDMKQSFGMIVRLSDMIETMQMLRSSNITSLFRPHNSQNTVSMSNISSGSLASIDMQGLLQSIRPFCTKRELSMVDQILNIVNMKKMMDTYQMMQSMMSMMNTSNSSDKDLATKPAQDYSDTYWSSHENTNTNYNYESNQTTSSNNNLQNEQMMDMLSAMVPPEQKGAFDAMKMMMEAGFFK